jgi:hypothetical protein
VPPGSPEATITINGRYLPPPPQSFQGEINLTAAQSKPLAGASGAAERKFGIPGRATASRLAPVWRSR